MTKTLNFTAEQQKELHGMMCEMAGKVEESLLLNHSLRKLNAKLVERLNEVASDFKKEFHIMTEMIVKNQIEFEEELYELNLGRRIKGGFMHEAPF